MCGTCPACVDGEAGDQAVLLWSAAQKIQCTEADILLALEEVREIAVYGSNGEQKKDLVYTMRQCDGYQWLFLAHCDMPDRRDGGDCKGELLTIKIRGTYTCERYDTLTGKKQSVPCACHKDHTILSQFSYPLDSLLLRLTPGQQEEAASAEEGKTVKNAVSPKLPDLVEYELNESNVLVLDLAEWSRDGKAYRPREELLRIDKALRQELGYPLADGEDLQPWCIPPREPTEFVYLHFCVESEIETECLLGFEQVCAVWQNGQEIEVMPSGYYVDKAVHTMKLPPLRRGTNEWYLLAPISERISLENYFLIGDFGVRVAGSHAWITALPEKLAFGSITGQGFPFYGADLTYKIPFQGGPGELSVTVDEYAGALVSARLDGREAGKIVLPPYELKTPVGSEGKHMLELTLYASRQNTFGPLHLAAPVKWKGPNMWYTENNMWSYEYRLADAGIIIKPRIKMEGE